MYGCLRPDNPLDRKLPYWKNGVPQGSVISPLLFNIAVNDISNHVTGVNISQYADDIALWKSNRNVAFIEKKIQQNLNNVYLWCEKWGYELMSIPKTIAVLFTNKKHTNTTLRLQNTSIQTHKSAKFLGVSVVGLETWSRWGDRLKIFFCGLGSRSPPRMSMSRSRTSRSRLQHC